MPEHITQIVLKALFAQNSKMKMATGRLFVSLTRLIMVRVLMELGEGQQMNPMDIGLSMMKAQLATGSVKMAKPLETGPMTMDRHLLEPGGLKETALGSELGPQMSLMKPSNTIAVITENLNCTPAPI